MEKLKEITVDLEVNSSKEEVWDLVFNRFGEVNVFNPLIEGSHHSSGQKGEVGVERVCNLDAKNSIREKITAARGNDSFDVDIIEGGLPMMDMMKATIDLKENDANQTKISFTMKFNTKPRFMAIIMTGMMRKMLTKMLIGLKYHLETGDAVTKENISAILNDYKHLPNGLFETNLKTSLA